MSPICDFFFAWIVPALCSGLYLHRTLNMGRYSELDPHFCQLPKEFTKFPEKHKIATLNICQQKNSKIWNRFYSSDNKYAQTLVTWSHLFHLCLSTITHNCFGPPSLLVEGVLSTWPTRSNFDLLVEMGLPLYSFSCIHVVRTRLAL